MPTAETTEAIALRAAVPAGRRSGAGHAPILAWVVPYLVCVVPFAVPTLVLGPDQRWASLAMLAAGALLVAAGRAPTSIAVRGALAAVAVTVLVVLTIPATGRTPVGLLFASLLLALLPPPAGATRPGPGAARILPLAFVGVSWIRTQSAREAALGLFVAALVVACERLRPTAFVGFDRRFAAVAERIGEILSMVVVAVVAVPILLLPTAVTTPIRRHRERRTLLDGSAWRTQQIDPTDEQRDARRPFAPTPRRHRRVLNLVGAVVVLACLAFVGVQVARRQGAPVVSATTIPPTLPPPGSAPPVTEPEPAQVPLRDRAAFADAPWADDLEREIGEYSTDHLPIDEELGYTNGDFDGKLVTVRDGVRTSIPPACDCPRVTVWVLGGSAAFGWNQRDQHTIPSELVRRAAAEGIALDIRNLAVPGWTIDQEQRLLARLVTELGIEPPDLVLFYDGFNDAVGSALEAAAQGPLDPEGTTSLDGRLLRSYGGADPDLGPAGGPEEVGRVAAERYRRAQDEVRKTLDGTGVPAAFVLQPDAFGSSTQLEWIEDVTKQPPAKVQASSIARALTAFERNLEGTVDLRHVLDDDSRPIFSDPVHMNELGARLTADAIYDRLEEQLRALSR